MTLSMVQNQAVTIGIEIATDVLAPFVQRAAQWRRSAKYQPLTAAQVGQLVKLSWRNETN